MPATARKLHDLEKRLVVATGADRDLDDAVAALLDDGSDGNVPEYTGSVDACLALIGRRLPDWHWHVGHGPSGILPYATLSEEHPAEASEERRVEAVAPTVPLALLIALARALRAGAGAQN